MTRSRRPRKRSTQKPGLTLTERSSGILAHITSLPGAHGNGDIGAATAFIDFLRDARQRWWQMLPVGPIGEGHSPYSARSAMAGEPLLLDLTDLTRQRLLTQRDIQSSRPIAAARVDYKASYQLREQLLRKSFVAFERQHRRRPVRDFEQFALGQRGWLDDYALYMALRHVHGDIAWTRWPADVRDRKPDALKRMRKVVGRDIRYHRYLQYQFHRQWTQLRTYARRHNVGLIGDIPFYVELDSADVWVHRELFKLNAKGAPTQVAGVPPDYFSRSGQLWGNPIYRWDVLKASDYAWWIARLRMALERFDAVRLDHFIGFHRAWSVPARMKTAKSGHYVKGPGAHVFERIKHHIGALPFIAEDLGVVTPEVTALREQFNLPGVRVVQFGFGDESGSSEHLPHNYPQLCVVYTGTHDNDTIVGWFNDRGTKASTRSPRTIARERAFALRYVGGDGSRVHWDMVRMAMVSPANLTIFPLQDILGLGSEARMNRPARPRGNWTWRVEQKQLTDTVRDELAAMTKMYGRSPK